MMRSLQWRLVLMLLALILLAMQFVGVYLLGSLERYYMDGFTSALATQGSLLAGFLERYLAGQPDQDELSRLLAEFAQQSGAGIAILNTSGAVVAMSGESRFRIPDVLLKTEIAQGLAGGRGESIRRDPVTGMRLLHLTLPVRAGARLLGAVYLVASLEDVYRTLGDIRMMLLGATGLALAITAILGLFLARTITGPVVRLTRRARHMAAGDFEEMLDVRSDDEIGQLGRMFNHLALRLRETLHEISSEKRKAEAILNYMADGILAVDGQGTVVLANPAAARLLGTTVADITGCPVGTVLGVPPRDTSGAGDDELTGEIQTTTGRLLKAWYAPVRNERGTATGVVIVLHDITEQTQLANMRREFVANVSHELRTPLTTVKSYVETLLDGALDETETARKFLGVVADETDRMARLVHDLLALSQLDHSRVTWERVPVDLGLVLSGAAERLRTAYQQKEISVTCHYPDSYPLVLGDPDRLEEVVLNLLSNAIEFTPPGGRIELCLGTDGEEVMASISDTGIGIPKEDLPRIFERFYRVDKARSRQMGGTGLGLAIAREMIEAHGGRIAIESQLGAGTTVRFWLPAQRLTSFGGGAS
ncbi:MAG: ATP-binding protein [Bacillota bacterium]